MEELELLSGTRGARLAAGKAIGWFQGSMELARAPSVLAPSSAKPAHPQCRVC
jgi:hypothetical protein